MQPAVGTDTILKYSDGYWESGPDLLAAEEPMEIRLDYGPESARLSRTVAVTMRTPGNDFELAVGFLFTEGVIRKYDEIAGIRYCTDGGTKVEQKNIVRVSLRQEVKVDLPSLERNFYTTSSCGVCGKSSIEAIRTHCPAPRSVAEWQTDIETILSLSEKLRNEQKVFEFTGGIHACAVFQSDGKMLMSREDVGRHNALDKLVGAFLVSGSMPLDHHLLLLSGRASFELLQKAAMAGIRFVAAVGAPSALAVKTAREFDITLLGFVRGRRFNVYNGGQRIRK